MDSKDTQTAMCDKGVQTKKKVQIFEPMELRPFNPDEKPRPALKGYQQDLEVFLNIVLLLFLTYVIVKWIVPRFLQCPTCHGQGGALRISATAPDGQTRTYYRPVGTSQALMRRYTMDRFLIAVFRYLPFIFVFSLLLLLFVYRDEQRTSSSF